MQFTTALRNAEVLIKELGDKFRSTIDVDCQRSSIQIPRRLGKGEMITYKISDGMDAFLLNGKLKSDWTINFARGSSAPVIFYTLANGIFQRSRKGKYQEDFMLEPLQSTICAQPARTTTQWVFGKDQEVAFLAILLHKKAFFSKVDCATLEIPEDLLATMKDIAGKKNFLFQDIFHLPIVQALNDIFQQEDIGLLNSTFATAKLYEILFLQLQQYQQNREQPQKSIVKPDNGLVRIRDAGNILVSRLQNPPTIPELAKMAGINQQTLKKGFKQLFGETINVYLNAKRLEQAEILIKNGGLKLQDIALEVGYNHPSYFSKKFKEKYGVTPRYYANQVQETMAMETMS
ncbi:helix-turn-helix transcriptional regulator [Lewinella sp. LCG006]|uniref:helix-turn-helix transcriptional regulator n=1 Tax=Lewinella sp. LCG006 TaxID=3231911 RepID=UPI00345FDF91